MRWPGNLAALASIAVATLGLDLLWLGVVARNMYDSQLGALKRPDVYWPAAMLFYALYVAAIFFYAVLGATSVTAAALRGAGMGLLAYATYELTNWAVLRGWPAGLVAVDIAWGVVLTTLAAVAGKLAQRAGS